MKIAFFYPAQIFKNQNKYLVLGSVHVMFSGLKKFIDQIDLLSFVDENGSVACTLKQELDLDKVNLIPLPSYRYAWELYFFKMPLVLWRMIKIFRRYAKEWQAIILYECGVVNQLAFILGKLYRVPIFFWVGGDSIKSVRGNLRYANKKKQFLKLLYIYENIIAQKILTKSAAGVFVTGNDLAGRFQRLNPDVYKFTATGVHASDIEPDLPDNRLQKTDNTFNILTVCSVYPSKGLDFMIEALALLHEKGIKTSYKIVGPYHDPGYAAILNNLIKDKKLEDNAKLMGEIKHGPELFQLYREADVFVLPSLIEGTPKVLPEAMSKGLPLVVSRAGGLPELVTHGIHGYLVEPGNTTELAGALFEIASDKELRYRMGNNVLQRAAEYTLERQMGGIASWIIEKTPHRK